ncbi:MAG: Rpn family recombination-promoting nuclease/putative transposase [Treponema sp.]|jgi:predicted transposase/invertase (TIGR01784 family)|nr:Rpn family recombination-promoting nuclease/putative transposase [Treponema sp.]
MERKNQKRLDPMNDYLAWKTFGEKGCEVQLLSLVNAMAGRKGGGHYQSIDIVENRTFSAPIRGNKTSVLDVRAVCPGRVRISLEIQNTNKYNIERRSFYYWGLEYISGILRGGDYRDLPDVKAFNLLGYLRSESQRDAGPHASFHAYEDRYREYLLGTMFEMHFIEVPRYRKIAKDLADPLHRWMIYMDRESPQEMVEEVMKMDQGILKAQEVMDMVTLDPELLRAYYREGMALSDEKSMLNGARQEGRQEERLEIARNMIQSRFDPELIAGITGLPPDVVRSLG